MVTKTESASTSSLTILTAADVDEILLQLDLEVALSSQAAVFHALSASASQLTYPHDVQTPQRLSLVSEHVTSLFMPSRIRSAVGMGRKIVSVPTGGNEGLPASSVLMDETSGKVIGLVNARRLTAVRNAAGSALFLRTFPPAGPPVSLVIFGTGAQAFSHATLLLSSTPSFTSCTFVARQSTSRAVKLVETLKQTFPRISIHLGIATSPSDTEDGFNLSQTIHNANVIVCVTPSTRALFNSVDVTSGTSVILVGSCRPDMKEVGDDLIRRAGMIVVDSKEACEAEAGELISAGIKGEDMVELGQALADETVVGEVRKKGDIVVFKSVGIGIQDVAIASLIFDQAKQLGLGITIPDYD